MGGNPSVRRGRQLPLHRGAEDNTPQFAVGDQLGNQGAFCLIREGTWRLGERHRRLW